MSKRMPTLVPNRKILEPQTEAQAYYQDLIKSNSVTLCTGPAGCGKTFVPTLMAVEDFLLNRVSKIVLVRPAVEACGEKLGFLPGDLLSKMDPFLGPIFDAMNEVWQNEKIEEMIHKGEIEVVPLAYMRGRTFNYSFILTDEAQNMTEDQMLMLLTRIGKESKMVISGDLQQNDLGTRHLSGLKRALNLVGKVDSIASMEFTAEDCVRNPVIIDILKNW